MKSPPLLTNPLKHRAGHKQCKTLTFWRVDMNIHAIENSYNSCDFCKKGWANYRGSAFIKNKTELHRIKTLSNNTFDICNSCSAKMCKTISEDLEPLK